MENDANQERNAIHLLDYNPNGQPVVLLIHGLGADGSSWGYQIPALIQTGMRAVAPDVPGFGKSAPLKGRWSITNATKSIANLMDELQISQAIVMGISMGGTIALQLALDYPARVKKLVLINTFASLRPKRVNEMLYMLARFVIVNLRGIQFQAEMVAKRIFPLPDQADLRRELIARILQSDPKVYREAMVSLGLFDVHSRLVEIIQPTLVVSGANDSTVSLPNQVALVKGIFDARHHIIENAGHALIVDQPDLLNQRLIAFINEEG